MKNFELLKKLIDELNISNSTLDKISTLSKPEYNDDFIKGVLKATHNPFKQYYVTSKNLKKRSDLMFFSSYNLFELLDTLSSRNISGYEAIGFVNEFIKKNSEYKEIIYNIFDRNLKTRVSEKIINKVFPGLIPTFNVALANKYDEKMAKRINFEDGWYASRKLDGLRCLAIIKEGNIKLYSRGGKEFLTLDVVKKALKDFHMGVTGDDYVLDGEICIVDKDGNEDFQAILKEYNRKNHTIQNPRFKIFDLIDLEAFYSKKGTIEFSKRNKIFKHLFKIFTQTTSKENISILDIVEQSKIISEEHLLELNTQAQEKGWEGMMIRKDIPYEGKRSNNLLKCKKFYDAEYIVKRIDIGPFRVIVDGLEVTENMMRNVSIEHKGFIVNVGSGFSIEERRHFKDHPNDIIGKEITVCYFEETKNQDGGISLRFPVVKAIYKEGRNEI